MFFEYLKIRNNYNSFRTNKKVCEKNEENSFTEQTRKKYNITLKIYLNPCYKANYILFRLKNSICKYKKLLSVRSRKTIK